MDKAIGFSCVPATDAGAGSLLIAARAFIRGANWNNTSNAGVFTLNLNNAPSNTNTNIGFRCSRYTHPRTCFFFDERPAHRGGGVRSARTKNPQDFRPCQEMYGNDPSRAKALVHIEPIPPSDTSSPREESSAGPVGSQTTMTKSPTFEDTCSFASLLAAYRRACKAGRYRREALEFGYRLESNLLALRHDLLNGTYRHGPYHEFTVVDAKKRKIKAACFRDRVVHQAVYHALEPLFEQGFIADSYACRKGKGTHAALRLLEVWLRRAPHLKYVLSCDISRYFASIDHELLLARIGKKLTDTRLHALCREIVESSSEAPKRGIPIGNLTSQLFANICLDEFDHYAKRALGCKHYVRYMDDFLILGENAPALRAMKIRIAEYLDQRLGLLLHPKKATVFLIAKSVSFLGYRVFPYHRFLRKSTVVRFSRRVRKMMHLLSLGEKMPEAFQAGLQSWAAYADYAATYGLKRFLGRQLAISFAPITNSPLLP